MSISKLEKSEFDYAKFVETISGREPQVLEALGLEPDSGGDVKCPCPIHGGDCPSGFSYSARLQIWKCWTHQCHEQYGCSLIGLVRGIKKLSFGDAISFIEGVLNLEFDKSDLIEVERNSYLRKTKISVSKDVPGRIFPESVLDKIEMKSPYFTNLGFSPATLLRYEVFEVHTPGKAMNGRAVATIRDSDGNIIGFTGRKVDDSTIGPKWLHAPTGIPLQRSLYGLWHARDQIRTQRACVIVEGCKDLWRLWEAKVPNSCALLGTNLSKDQIRLLKQAGVTNLLLLLDADNPGRAASLKIQQSAHLYFNIYDLSDIISQGDPGEADLETLTKVREEIEKICQSKL